jgi:hydroxypyruvate reductase
VAPAAVESLLLSDVIGDDLDVIGSGPTAPDASTFAGALAILEKFDLLERVPAAVRLRLDRGARGELPETPKPGDRLFRGVRNVLVGNNRLALDAAAARARALGFRTLVLSSEIQGETREIARMHAAIAREIVSTSRPVKAPACIITGGETTVTLHGDGLGGRNQEFVLAAALEIAGLRHVVVLSAGTDGSDGPTDAAGAIADGDTLRRNPEARRYLDRNDSYRYFQPLNDLVITGPTNTNVMDVRIILVGAGK